MILLFILLGLLVIESIILIVQVSHVIRDDRKIKQQLRGSIQCSLYAVPPHDGFYRRALYHIKRRIFRIKKSLRTIDISSVL